MRHLALATDYDGTLAQDGVVDRATLAALHDFRRSGRRLILVTGRVLEDLQAVFPHLDLFELAVLENGALLYAPARRETRRLFDPPDPRLLEAMRRRGVAPLSTGEVIVSTTRPNEARVLESIAEVGLPLDVIFNKSSVMILPAGVNKQTGLAVALAELNLSPRDVIGIGDAENDFPFLEFCGTSVAVANAIVSLKDAADLVTDGARGAGVAEVIGRVLSGDFALKFPGKDPQAQPVA